jgi:hypothetical protein
VPVEAFRVGKDPVGRFFEGNENAGFPAMSGAVRQESKCEDSLSRAWATQQQSGSAARKSTAGDFIESGDACRRLGYRLRNMRFRRFQKIFPVRD